MNKTSAVLVRTLLLGTSCLSVLGLGRAYADPTGGTVVLGSATITSNGSNSTVITQTSNKALITWDSFSIAAGGTVRFDQPGSSAIAVNRVIGSQPSSIYGNLLANGQVWLINGNGILFGKGSQINVGGLIATTSDIRDADFANGNYSFGNGTGASVVNQGTIRTRNGGSAVLSGASVSNQGLIQADAGTVVLGGASSFTVDFDGDNLLRYAIGAPAATATNGHTGVSNSGTIVAAGGRVIMTARAAANVADAVVNNTGMISATSATVQNGEVILDGGDGDVNVGGTIDVTGKGAGQTGGSVTVTGHNITVADNATIDASGDSGGGNVRIGGDLHGTGALPDAANLTVGKATIKADATRTGNGGTIVMWSNGLTDFSGIASAMGGFLGGDGGLVETSGHRLNVTADASVDTRAPKGQTGTWLLDPDTIVIQSGEGSGTPIPPGGTVGVNDNPGGTDFIAPDTIVAALANTNVTLEAASEIDVNENVIYSSPNTLSLLSEGNINVNASILNMMATGGGGLTLVAGWDGVTAPGSILTTPGAYGNSFGEGVSEVFLDGSEGNVHVGSASGTTTVAAGAVTLLAGAGSAQLGYYGSGGGGGDILVSALGDVSLTGGDPTDLGTYAMIGNGAPAGSVTGNVIGNVTGNVTIAAAGALNLSTQQDDCGCEAPSVTTIAIGNATTSGTVSGSVTIFADYINDGGDANGGLSAIAARDLANGDFTAGITDSEFSLSIDSDVIVSSTHTLTLLSAGDLDINASIQNSGSGAVNLVAGWDGVSGAAQLGSAGTFGLNGGSVYMGGEGAFGNVYVGSAGGNTAVYTSGLYLDAVSVNTQLGFNGGGATGIIHVEATGDIELDGGNGFAQIGHGGAGTTGSDSGDINVAAVGTISLNGGAQFNSYAQIGHGGTSANDTPSASFIYAGNIDVTGSAVTLTGGSGSAAYVQIGHGGQDVGNDPSVAISEMESGNITVTASAGDVALTAGSDTAGNAYAQIGHGGAYGGIIFSGDPGVLPTHSMTGAITVQAFGGSVSVTATGDENAQSDYAQIGHGGVSTSGAEGGDILVYADNDITLTGGTAQPDGLGLSYAQIGNGAGRNDAGLDTGNITVTALGDLTLTGSEGAADGTNYVQIGNGSFWNINGGSQGPASGNIAITIGGATTISTLKNGGDVWIGNVSTGETGAVTLITGTFDDSGDDQGDFTRFMGQDITGGDITLGFTDPEANSVELPGLGTYNSAHLLTILSAGTLDITSSIQNAGTGAITLVGGWDGTTLDPAHLADAGVFGNGGTINIGATSDAPGDVFVGVASGTLNIYTGSLSLNTDGGNAQVGYHGAGGGDINVVATGDINGFGNSENDNTLQLGNGTLADDVTGNVTGNITLSAGGQTVFFSQEGESWLGNHASTGFKEVGNLTSVSVTGSYSADYMEGDLGTSSDTGGNVFLGFDGDPTEVGFRVGGIVYSSPHDFVFATAASLDVTGSVINGGTGAVTLVSGWDGTTIGTGAQILAAGAFGLNGTHTNVGGDHMYTIGQGEGSFSFSNNQFEDISIGSAGGLTSVLAGDIVIAPSAGFYAQIGYHGTGGGNIEVVALGDLTLTPGTGEGEYAMIGNGSLNNDVTGAITGNIDIQVGGTSTLGSDGDTAPAWVGNVAGTGASETGSVTLVTGDLDGEDEFGANVAADVAGGDVTIGITDPDSQESVFDVPAFTSAHTLNLLSAGSWTFGGSVQNAGTGAINIVAGWDGATLDAAHFGDAGVYGNNDGAITIGGANADGDVAVGSLGGTTSLYADSVTVQAANGYAQVGYHGLGTGAVTVLALGDVSVSGSNFVGQIGNGGTDVSGAVGGTVSVNSASLEVTANANAVAAVGNIAGSNGSESGNVTINTNGGTLVLSSFGQGSHAHIGNWTSGDTTGTSSGNITLDAGALTLAANGGNAYSQIGNGTFRFGVDSGAMSGTILIHATTFDASATNGQVRVGNLGVGPVGGDLSIYTTGDFTLTGNVNSLVNIGDVFAGTDTNGNSAQAVATGNLLVQSGGAVTLTGVNGGNARIETGDAASGSITVNAVGDITLNAGVPNGTGSGSFVFIGSLIGGNGGVNIAVTSSTGAVSLNANEAGSRAVIGNSENGSLGGVLSGTITVTASNAANGNINLTAAGANATAHIGNEGYIGETVTGDIVLTAGHAVTLGAANGTGEVLVGNTNESGDSASDPAPFTGAVTINTASLSGNIAPSLANDLSGGNVLLKLTGPNAFTLNGAAAYSSSYTLTVLDAGSIVVSGSIQNAGTGAITLLAGWDGTTTAPGSFTNAGVFGNNGGSVTIGGSSATGDAAVGSAGSTNIDAANVTVAGVNGYAQLGYHGSGGAIVVHATGSVSLTGSNAQIGDGTTLGSNAQAGAVSIFADTVQGQSGDTIAATDLVFGTAHDIGSSTAPVTIAANTLALSNGGGAYLASPTKGVTIASSGVHVLGMFSLSAGGTIAQTGSLSAGGLNVATTSGDIVLNNLLNDIAGSAPDTFHAAGAVTFYDIDSFNLGASMAGGDMTLLSKGSIVVVGSVQDLTGAVTLVAGWDGSTTAPASFGNSGVYGNNSGTITVGGTGAIGNVAVGSQSGTTSLYASAVTLTATSGYAQIGYHGTGGGAIKLVAQHDLTLNGGSGSATVGNGGTDVTGAVTGDIDIRVGGNLVLNSADANTRAWIGNRTSAGGETGNVIILATNVTGTQDCNVGCFAQADIVGGDVTLGVSNTTANEIDDNISYNSAHTLNLLVGGSLTISGSIQNAGTGAINLVAGWDGHTIAPSSFGTAGVYGNNSGNVLIGGSTAEGNASFGSAGGTTSVYANTLSISGLNGYAQLGYHGAGNGALSVVTIGTVILAGGSGTGDYAQIGNGGLGTTGSNHGDIDIAAGSDVVLNAGAGSEAYAQIGHGGAESNSNSQGYENVAPITITAANVLLVGNTGTGAYAQIGNGGLKSGAGIGGGTATDGGDITITASHAVGLTGGAGADGYTQIGNGGSQSNLNPAAGASGSDSGNIVVTTPNGEGGSVTLASGAGANAYSQIGNGGYDINTGTNATVASWTVTGNVSVTDLSLTGGNSGSNAYSQIGNGDASKNGTGNISGDITIDANGDVTYTNGSAPHSNATIGNFTGHGTAEGTLTGANPPSDVTSDPVIIGNIASNTANNGSNTNAPVTTIATVVITTEQAASTAPTATTVSTTPPGPLASLDNGGDTSPPNSSDTATVVIADSLDGAKKVTGSTTILAGMLKQTVPTATGAVHGVPPADQDFSSWGNEALWQ
ncbi:MAG TPA: filamentous hemagglutinin N-terminal domain-containing protein [Rhizomicrobium sp.]|jgi:filamentous hemagglutinin family protein|nr:filamentous hemagglutinin N-terminal domain-containing protein [Rhizomicrobium sp.]